MGWAMVMGSCVVCGGMFSFHPHKVPSIRHPETGNREPVCESCVTRINAGRRAAGIEEFRVLPGAYEPCHESEL